MDSSNPNNEDKLRAASANVARSQISRIFGDGSQPSSANSRLLNPASRVTVQPPTTAQPHTPESTPSNPAATNDDRKVQEEKLATKIAADFQAEQIMAASKARETAEARAAYERYHNSWQQYYQKYYEKYYMSAVEQKSRDFDRRLSEATANLAANPIASDDGSTMSQKEAVDELRNDLRAKIKRAGQKVRKSRHFVPAMCAIVVVILAAFVQYNQLLFAQINSFISPGAMTDQNIIVGTGMNQPVGEESRIIIPKINVNAPVIYGLDDWGEEASQRALQDGTIHYPIRGASARPGQNGNTVILGHSSSDWFSPGSYKFIFVQLNRLAAGDLFYLEYEGVRYTYRVSHTEVINPNEVGKLAIGNDKPYATLITCDPPGTALRRLVVYADQISPDPAEATNSQKDDSTIDNDSITGNPPTLFELLFGR